MSTCDQTKWVNDKLCIHLKTLTYFLLKFYDWYQLCANSLLRSSKTQPTNNDTKDLSERSSDCH